MWGRPFLVLRTSGCISPAQSSGSATGLSACRGFFGLRSLRSGFHHRQRAQGRALMPAVRRVAQFQRGGDVLGLLRRRLAAQPEQQELAPPRADADKQVLADFELLGAPQLGGSLLGMAQGVAQPDGDGGRNGYGASPASGPSALRPRRSMSANCSATSRGDREPPGRYQV